MLLRLLISSRNVRHGDLGVSPITRTLQLPVRVSPHCSEARGVMETIPSAGLVRGPAQQRGRHFQQLHGGGAVTASGGRWGFQSSTPTQVSGPDPGLLHSPSAHCKEGLSPAPGEGRAAGPLPLGKDQGSGGRELPRALQTPFLPSHQQLTPHSWPNTSLCR